MRNVTFSQRLMVANHAVLQRAPEGFTLGHFGFFDATDGQKNYQKGVLV